MKKGRPKRKDLDVVDQHVAVQMYERNQLSIKRIAEALDASYWEVREVLLKKGVVLRPRGRVKGS